MRREGVADSSQDRKLVSDTGKFGEMLRDLDPGDIGCDRIERAANLGGRIRLQVKGIQVGRTTRELDKDRPIGTAGLDLTGMGHPHVTG